MEQASHLSCPLHSLPLAFCKSFGHAHPVQLALDAAPTPKAAALTIGVRFARLLSCKLRPTPGSSLLRRRPRRAARAATETGAEEGGALRPPPRPKRDWVARPWESQVWMT